MTVVERAVSKSQTQGTEALTAAGALGVIIGGAYGFAIMGIGLWSAAEGSFPLFFGIRLGGDRSYPFPWPDEAVLGAIVGVLGAVLVAIFVRTAIGSAAARRAAIAALALVVIGAGWTGQRASSSRRCAFETYTDSNHCMSGTASTLRDFVLLASPAMIALGCLTFSRSRQQ